LSPPQEVEGQREGDIEHLGDGARVEVEDPHVAGHGPDPGIPHEGRDEMAQGIGKNFRIRIQCHEYIAAGFGESGQQSVPLAHVARLAHEMNTAGKLRRSGLHPLPCVIPGAIIDTDHLHLGDRIGAGHDRPDGGKDLLTLVEGGNNDRDTRKQRIGKRRIGSIPAGHHDTPSEKRKEERGEPKAYFTIIDENVTFQKGHKEFLLPKYGAGGRSSSGNGHGQDKEVETIDRRVVE